MGRIPTTDAISRAALLEMIRAVSLPPAAHRTSRRCFCGRLNCFICDQHIPLLKSGAQPEHLRADDTALAYVRSLDTSNGCESDRATERVLVALNKGGESRTLTLPTAATGLDGCKELTPLFPSATPAVKGDSVHLSLVLPANGFVIYEARTDED